MAHQQVCQQDILKDTTNKAKGWNTEPTIFHGLIGAISEPEIMRLQ